MKEPLETQLRTLNTPRMPADTEARIRRRLHDAMRTPAAPTWQRRFLWRGSYAQLALLIALLAVAGWVVATQVYPALVSAWERYCTTPSPSVKR